MAPKIFLAIKVDFVIKKTEKDEKSKYVEIKATIKKTVELWVVQLGLKFPTAFVSSMGISYRRGAGYGWCGEHPGDIVILPSSLLNSKTAELTNGTTKR
mgnify:CR=1